MFYPGQMGPLPYPHSNMMQIPAKPEGNDSQMENSQEEGSDLDEKNASSMGDDSQQREGAEVVGAHAA